MSLTIEPGELVAIVGPSGAGKTTTAMLVPRIADVNEGAVRIDGHDVRDLTLASLREAVGFVMQDPHLFHDTIAENLRYAKPGRNRRRARSPRAARRVSTSSSRHSPTGTTRSSASVGIGCRAARSNGVAIARVLLKAPAIVILDEATSHLDTESEHAIQQALTAALAGRTALVIAHRLSTIVERRSDRRHRRRTDRGQGTHGELMRRGGLYADLYRTQVDQLAEAPVDDPRRRVRLTPDSDAAPGSIGNPIPPRHVPSSHG